MKTVYNSKRWQRLRAAKLAADALCQYCPGVYRSIATEVDHRTPISKGGDPWQWNNIASTCHECHSHKTMVVDRLGREHTPAPIKGVDPRSGLPLDPGHWWRQ